jgi:hypothetical protein
LPILNTLKNFLKPVLFPFKNLGDRVLYKEEKSLIIVSADLESLCTKKNQAWLSEKKLFISSIFPPWNVFGFQVVGYINEGTLR